MVSTNSITPDLNYTVVELQQSPFAEDKKIVDQTCAAVSAVVEKLKPILLYIATTMPGGSMLVKVAPIKNNSKTFACLDKYGKWYSFDEEEKKAGEHNSIWTNATVANVLKGLGDRLKEAEGKRQEHLSAIKKREELLSNIDAVLRGEAVAAQK